MIRNRAVWNAVRDAILLADIETGMIVDANPAAEALCGRSLEELRSLHHTELHPPQAEGRARDAFDQRTWLPGTTEGHILHNDGHLIPVEISASDFTTSDGRRMLVGLFRDTTERNEAREALRRSEERLRQVTESAGEFIWEVDANGLYLYASPMVEQILGYTPDEVVGRMHFYDLFAPETHEETKTAAFEVFSRREEFRAFLNLNVTKDGRIVVLETSGLPVLDRNGNLLGYRGAGTDVTEHKRAEEALRENERRLVSIYNTVRDVIFQLAVEPEGQFRFVSVNAAFLNVTGLSLERVVGKTVNEIIPEPSLTMVLGKYRQAVEGKTIVLWEETSDYPAGRLTGEVSVAPVFDNKGTCTHLVGSVHDITERKRAAEAVRAGEDRWRSIFENSAVGIALTDPRGFFSATNRAYQQLVGYTEEELRSLPYLDITYEEDRPANAALFRELWEGKLPQFAHEKRYVRKDGKLIWVRTTVSLAAGGETLPRFGMAIVEDITERKLAEEALRRSEEKFATLFRCIPASITVSDLNDGDRFLEVNAAFEDFTGHRRETVIGRTCPPDWLWVDPLEYAEAVSQFTRSGKLSNFEYRFRRKSGEIRTGILSAESIDFDGKKCVVATTIDITDRKGALEALRESEERFSLAQSAADLVAWDWDLRTNLITLCGKYPHVYGLTPERSTLTYEEWLSAIHADDRERVQALIRESLQRTHILDAEFRVKWPDGTTHWVVAKGTVFLDDSGRPIRALGVNGEVTERRRAEEALRASEERFRVMADTAPVMVWVSGPDKLCTFLNKPWLDFTGHTMEREIGDGWASGVHPDDLERCLATYHSSFDARRNFQMEYRHRRADGEYRWLLDTGTPLYREGEFVGFIGSCVDVTEQKLIEDRLRANEARLMEAQRLAKVGSWERRLEDDRTRWSDEVYRIFGLPNDAPTNFDTFLSYVHPKDREKVLQARHRLEAKDPSAAVPVEMEYRIIRSDGDMRFLRTVVETIRNDEGTQVRAVGATQDITEQVKARESLRESEERLRHAERIAHVGHWDWNIKSNRISCSEETLQIVGRPQAGILSYEESLQFVSPQDRDRVDQWARDCLAEKRGDSIEVQIARPDGDLRTVTLTPEVLLDDNGNPVRMVGTCQDVTDSRREQNEAYARQKLESLGTLAGGIAHDFNNILGGVLAQAELALAAPGSHPEEELQRIRDVALQGAEIVRQLMVYAGTESEVVELVEVSRIVREMFHLIRISVSKHAALETDLGEHLPAVRANAAQLRRIVMNLVTNASEAIGDRDGVIRVTTRRVTFGRAAAISKGLAHEGDYLQLEVSDTGHGMPLDVQAKVFDPFFSTRSAGRGLGLAVVHGVVRNLRGAIHVVSEPGKGTTVQILLPCAEAVAGAIAGSIPGAEETERPSQEATILFVEDEDTLRQPVAKMLRKAGFEVVEASDGSAAVDLLRASGGKIDVILLDLTVPGASSQEVVAEAAQVRSDVKVILTSAYSEERATALMGAAQMKGFIRKPFQLGNLVQMVRNVLSS